MQGIILTSQYWESGGRGMLAFHGRLENGKRFFWKVPLPQICFFIQEDADISEIEPSCFKPVELKTLLGTPVVACYFESQARLKNAADRLKGQGIPVFEGDISVANRYLMERFICGVVNFELPASGFLNNNENILCFDKQAKKGKNWKGELKPLSFDLECCASSKLLYSISIAAPGFQAVYMLDRSRRDIVLKDNICYCPDERTLLLNFFKAVDSYDPDIFIGWNIVGFDFPFLAQKCLNLGLTLGMGLLQEEVKVLPASEKNQLPTILVPGRAVIDGIQAFKGAMIKCEDYKLDTVAKERLGREKLITKVGQDKIDEIDSLFKNDKKALAHYNLEDSILVLELFQKDEIIDLQLQRLQKCGLFLGKTEGSVAAFDNLYLPRLHRSGFVAPGSASTPAEARRQFSGGLVLEPRPGFYQNVILLDFKSLYPSIIRTFSLDPLGLIMESGKEKVDADTITLPGGQRFSREYAILPDILAELTREREKARAEKKQTLSLVLKIIMNSFYGVLGTPVCRFYDPRLAESITKSGQWILKSTIEFLQSKDFKVIYGDTDSLFLHLPQEVEAHSAAKKLVKEINSFWYQKIKKEFGLKSLLEIEFEQHFLKLFLPAIRGSDIGSKKRYAGLVFHNGEREIIFKGMEQVRRDWTPLAKKFQKDLLMAIFNDEEYLELTCQRIKSLRNGQLDNDLVYKKSLNKKIEEYSTLPPHAVAASKMKVIKHSVIEYILTINGPEPLCNNPKNPDYEHYYEKQLKPVGDSILQFFNSSCDEISRPEKQLSLF
ncbi:DNA polymerase II [Candidatus Riflebacteria bacterium]